MCKKGERVYQGVCLKFSCGIDMSYLIYLKLTHRRYFGKKKNIGNFSLAKPVKNFVLHKKWRIQRDSNSRPSP